MDRRKHPPLESAKRKKYLFCRAKRGRHFVDQSNTNGVPDARNSALDRHLSTQIHFRNMEMRSRSTPGDPNAFLIRSNALALDACRPKCISGVLKYALAQRLSIKMRFRSVEMRSRSTPVDPNAFPIRSDAFSLDARRPKCILGMLKYALARRPSIQMRFRSVEMRSRSTPVDPNAFPIRSNALSLDACRSKCSRALKPLYS